MSQLKESQQLKMPFKVIEEATGSFKNIIGNGGYGRVYRGQLSRSGQLINVAVKRLDKQFGQGLKEFLTEIKLLKGQTHPNLISLLGYCNEGKEKILVYEYAERGSLDNYFTRNDNTTTLTWIERLRICVDIARGLDHLHNHVGEHQTIIHRDIKSANILLDHNLVAKVSDFGLSKLSLAGLDRSAVISYACGTPGYVEPEYFSSCTVTKESDVYSFGMVLLEILCGRLCGMIDNDGLYLEYYYRENKLKEIVDPRIKQQMSSDSVTRYLEIADGCLHPDRGKRHTIDRAMKDLEELLEIEIKSDELLDWSSDSDFTTLVTRRTNVGKLFDIFDLNRDGGLNRQELATFLLVSNFSAKHGEEHIDTCVDDVFWYYDKYINGEKGLTYHGLLQYYDDGRGDLDSDIVQVPSYSDSDNDDDDDDYKDDDNESHLDELKIGKYKLSNTYDHVQRKQYLYVSVVKAKNLVSNDVSASCCDLYVEVWVGRCKGTTRHIEKSSNPDWNQVFAFARDHIQANMIDITVKDKDAKKDDFIGCVLYDLCAVPKRAPPDSPVAPQWYKLENRKGKKLKGEVMLAIWWGIQADEVFPEAWHTDDASVREANALANCSKG